MGIRNNLTLLSNIAAAGNGADVLVATGGLYALAVNGTFGGTSFKMQIKGPDGANYIDVPSTTFTAAGIVGVEIPSGAIVRAVLTGGTPSAFYANLSLVR